jgi:transcriptional regulator with XRE-family HTH domain
VVTRETRLHRGRRRGEQITRSVIDQLRDARVSEGISQAALAEQLGKTQAYVSMLESGKLSELSLVRLAEIASVLGLEPALALHRIGPPLRDKGHEALIARFRIRISPRWKIVREAPFPGEGDPRFWDLLLRHPTEHYLGGVEAETRVRDLQALVRRMRQRATDGGADDLVIVLSDSATNRGVVGHLREALGEEFATESARILAALAAPARLPGSAVLLL